MEWAQYLHSFSILWHCLSLGLKWKLTFSSPVSTSEFSKFSGVMSAAWASLGAQIIICLQCRRPGSDPWIRKIPWRRKWLPTPVFLPGESHRQRSLATLHGVAKSWARLSDWHFHFSECSTLIASSFRILNSSAGISSPPVALFVVILPKAHLTSHYRISGSMWVTTTLWFSGSLRPF